MQKSTGRSRTPPPRNDAVLLATAISLGDAAVAELRGLRADVRELIAVLRTQRTPPVVEHAAEVAAKLPTMMTIAEAAEMLRTSSRSLYMRIRRGVMPGVVRVGPRRLMVKTDEFLRELHRMPTVE
jgi:excisionase family DNA binding protein